MIGAAPAGAGLHQAAAACAPPAPLADAGYVSEENFARAGQDKLRLLAPLAKDPGRAGGRPPQKSQAPGGVSGHRPRHPADAASPRTGRLQAAGPHREPVFGQLKTCQKLTTMSRRGLAAEANGCWPVQRTICGSCTGTALGMTVKGQSPRGGPKIARNHDSASVLMTRTDTATTKITDILDSFYCYNIAAALWTDAVINRLEGLAIFLLRDELAEVADRARTAARRLADRIGDLGGAITADPRQLLDRSIPVDFALPDCSDIASIGEYGLQRLDAIIAAYQAFLDQVRGTDDVSFHLVLKLLAAETHQRADLQAALARRS